MEFPLVLEDVDSRDRSEEEDEEKDHSKEEGAVEVSSGSRYAAYKRSEVLEIEDLKSITVCGKETFFLSEFPNNSNLTMLEQLPFVRIHEDITPIRPVSSYLVNVGKTYTRIQEKIVDRKATEAASTASTGISRCTDRSTPFVGDLSRSWISSISNNNNTFWDGVWQFYEFGDHFDSTTRVNALIPNARSAWVALACSMNFGYRLTHDDIARLAELLTMCGDVTLLKRDCKDYYVLPASTDRVAYHKLLSCMRSRSLSDKFFNDFEKVSSFFVGVPRSYEESNWRNRISTLLNTNANATRGGRKSVNKLTSDLLAQLSSSVDMVPLSQICAAQVAGKYVKMSVSQVDPGDAAGILGMLLLSVIVRWDIFDVPGRLTIMETIISACYHDGVFPTYGFLHESAALEPDLMNAQTYFKRSAPFYRRNDNVRELLLALRTILNSPGTVLGGTYNNAPIPLAANAYRVFSTSADMENVWATYTGRGALSVIELISKTIGLNLKLIATGTLVSNLSPLVQWLCFGCQQFLRHDHFVPIEFDAVNSKPVAPTFESSVCMINAAPVAGIVFSDDHSNTSNLINYLKTAVRTKTLWTNYAPTPLDENMIANTMRDNFIFSTFYKWRRTLGMTRDDYLTHEAYYDERFSNVLKRLGVRDDEMPHWLELVTADTVYFGGKNYGPDNFDISVLDPVWSTTEYELFTSLIGQKLQIRTTFSVPMMLSEYYAGRVYFGLPQSVWIGGEWKPSWIQSKVAGLNGYVYIQTLSPTVINNVDVYEIENGRMLTVSRNGRLEKRMATVEEMENWTNVNLYELPHYMDGLISFKFVSIENFDLEKIVHPSSICQIEDDYLPRITVPIYVSKNEFTTRMVSAGVVLDEHGYMGLDLCYVPEHWTDDSLFN